MDNSWRPRPPPPIQGNTCPICSISHFPFCPPPPPPMPFNQNPRFVSHTSPSFQRPFFDPYLDHPGPHMNPHRPFGNPDDRFVDPPPPWHRNPSYDHGGSGFKRMRVDEMGKGSFVNESPVDLERRLKLIRDHGGVEGGRLDELRGCRTDMALKPPVNYEMNEFLDPRFGDFDRKGSYNRPEFNSHNYGEEHGLAFGQENSRGYGSDELGQSRYGERENSLLANGLGRCSNSKDTYSPSTSYRNGKVHSENYYPSAQYHEQRSSYSTENHDPNHRLSQPYATQNGMQMSHDFHSHGQLNDRIGNQGSFGYQNGSTITTQHFNKQGGYVPISTNMIPMQASRVVDVQPPLPASPPPPLPLDPHGQPHGFSSAAITSSSLFPIAVSSAATTPTSYTPIAEAHSLAQPYFHDKPHLHALTAFATEESQNFNPTFSTKYYGEGQRFPPLPLDKPKVVDASHLFKQPQRATRPDHIVIILRGLPGSGKSYLAKMLRDLEVENGGDAPRIHSMDDYFMTEVEKAEDSDFSKSSNSVRGKKPVMKKVMEYSYEPEMEEAYRSSMLKAFKKTLDEGVFSFVIVDDRNLRVADFAQFWATAKRSGYEVYLLEAPYKDPAGCAARNVHGFTQDDVENMSGQWEEAPSLYLKLDIKSLFQGDDLKEGGIQEVDMDMEDGEPASTLSRIEERDSEIPAIALRDYSPNGSSKDDKKWDAKGEHLREEVKELGRSKWSDDLDDSNVKRSSFTKGNINALSGLIKAYAKEGKSVHWGDQAGNTGFSIGVARKVNASLVIGPGAGYNLKSNTLPEEQVSNQNTSESRGQSVFQERIRAERESFRAVFDKRRHRIGGLNLEEE